MNEEILIELGEVSEETKGCPGGLVESPEIFGRHDEVGGEC